MADKSNRLREHPRRRFAGDQRQLNLDAAFDALPGESVGRHGHMQKTLYHRGPFTIAIFEFDAGARLDSHSVDGEAVIEVLDGSFRVNTQQEQHDLKRRDLLILDPGVPHDVTAIDGPARFLLTVVLHRNSDQT